MADSKSDNKTMNIEVSPLKDNINKVSGNIVSEMKALVDDPLSVFSQADPLKEQINKFGSEATDEEKELLNQATDDYTKIKSAQKNIHKSLDEIGSIFDEKTRRGIELSENARKIESKIDEINKHLDEYDRKCNLLTEKGDDKVEAEDTWEEKARIQMTKLKYAKNNLNSSLIKIHLLQEKLDAAENEVTEKLDALVKKVFVVAVPPPESAKEIKEKMGELKEKACDLDECINNIKTFASDVFSSLFEGIKEISSTILGQLKTADTALEESRTVLNAYPDPVLTAGRNMRY